jgi:hypothetical protein
MPYRMTEQMRDSIEDLAALRSLVEEQLHLASSAAREEWIRLCTRIPILDDANDLLPLSEADLEEVKMKIVRCAKVLANQGDRAVPRTVPFEDSELPTSRPS